MALNLGRKVVVLGEGVAPKLLRVVGVDGDDLLVDLLGRALESDLGSVLDDLADEDDALCGDLGRVHVGGPADLVVLASRRGQDGGGQDGQGCEGNLHFD